MPPIFSRLDPAALPADCALTPVQGPGVPRYCRLWHDAPPLQADWGRVAIEWTDATWNPVTGCTKVGPG
ncbi:MAG: DUF5131 family protein [Rhodobacteraceae bacterium]|nr:DUF5131 family protein [Paracoccaceae bacterium]